MDLLIDYLDEMITHLVILEDLNEIRQRNFNVLYSLLLAFSLLIVKSLDDLLCKMMIS